jgi:hypothetical protein
MNQSNFNLKMTLFIMLSLLSDWLVSNLSRLTIDILSIFVSLFWVSSLDNRTWEAEIGTNGFENKYRTWYKVFDLKG